MSPTLTSTHDTHVLCIHPPSHPHTTHMHCASTHPHTHTPLTCTVHPPTLTPTHHSHVLCIHPPSHPHTTHMYCASTHPHTHTPHTCTVHPPTLTPTHHTRVLCIHPPSHPHCTVNEDYTTALNQFTLEAGETRDCVRVTILEDDQVETLESFRGQLLSLVGPDGNLLPPSTRVTLEPSMTDVSIADTNSEWGFCLWWS